MTKIGLYIGRFQPFHLGHLSVVRQMSNEMDQSYIILGSADKSEENPNPFTVKERAIMINRVLNGKGIENVSLAGGVEDAGSDRTWLSRCIVILGSTCFMKFSKMDISQVHVYTRNPIVEKLFSEAGFKIRIPKAFPLMEGKREILSATYIRECIKFDRDDWINLVPCEVQDYIYECHGIATIKRCS